MVEVANDNILPNISAKSDSRLYDMLSQQTNILEDISTEIKKNSVDLKGLLSFEKQKIELQKQIYNSQKAKESEKSLETRSSFFGNIENKESVESPSGSASSSGGKGALGALSGIGLKGLAIGLAAFANPATILGGTTLIAFLAGLGGVTWLFGKGAQAVGQGFADVASGLERLDEAGENFEVENLEKAGEGLSSFLSNVGGIKSAFGAAITFLTGDLENIATGLEKLNTIKVDKQSLQDAGEGLNTFMSALGEGSMWDKIKGAISSAIPTDFENIANGVNILSDTSKNVDVSKFTTLGEALSEINEPLYEFSKSGIASNFVGAEALSDISSGISALNETKVDKLSQVGEGLTTIKDPLIAMTGIGLAANFVGKQAIIDIADGAKHMNDVLGQENSLERANTVAKTLNAMRDSISEFATSQLWNNLKSVGSNIVSFFGGDESPIETILSISNQANDLSKSASALDKITNALDKLSTIKIDADDINLEGLGVKFNKFSSSLKESTPLTFGDTPTGASTSTGSSGASTSTGSSGASTSTGQSKSSIKKLSNFGVIEAAKNKTLPMSEAFKKDGGRHRSLARLLVNKPLRAGKALEFNFGGRFAVKDQNIIDSMPKKIYVKPSDKLNPKNIISLMGVGYRFTKLVDPKEIVSTDIKEDVVNNSEPNLSSPMKKSESPTSSVGPSTIEEIASSDMKSPSSSGVSIPMTDPVFVPSAVTRAEQAVMGAYSSVNPASQLNIARGGDTTVINNNNYGGGSQSKPSVFSVEPQNVRTSYDPFATASP